MKTQAIAFCASLLTAVLSDLVTYLQARQRALDAEQTPPPYRLERLAEKLAAGIVAGLAGVAGITVWGGE